MGMYGQVPAAFSTTGPEAGAPPGYGWFWGMMGAPNASGGPARHPMQGQTQASGAGKVLLMQGMSKQSHLASAYLQSFQLRLPILLSELRLNHAEK